MKKLLLLSWLICLNAFGVAYTSTQSGLFSAGSTWVGGVAPSLSGDTWTIATGNTVTYDVNNLLSLGWGNSVVTGTLSMANGATAGGSVYLLMNGNLSGTGSWTIGTSGTPITYSVTNTPNVYIQFSNATAQCTMTKTAGLPWYGTPHITNMYLSSSAALNATSITVSNVPSWLNTNDIIWIAPTNTVQNQGGEYYMVAATNTGNIIYITNGIGGNTNFYPGTAFKTSIPTSGRQIGCQVAVFGSSVVVLETTQRTVSTITSSATNTLSGIMVQNLGRGLASSCSGWTATGNTANNCNNGGLAINSCSGWTVTGNTVNNCVNGGLASSCSGWTVTGNTANNCLSGGLAYICSGWTVTGNTVNNCLDGGLASSSCFGWTVTGNTANNCNNGGLAFSCSGWTVTGNTVNNCVNGGLAINSSGLNLWNTTNVNSSPLFKSCNNITAWLTTTNSSGDSLFTATDPVWLPIQYDNTKWVSTYGIVTNNTNNYFIHIPNTINQLVPLHILFSVRPGAYRNVFLTTQATNSVVYSAVLTLGGVQPATTMPIINSGGNISAWTNTTLQQVNTNTFPVTVGLWLAASCPSVNSNGYSSVSIGQDMVVNKY